MNRRSFIQLGALWVPPLFAIGRARGQAITLADPAMVGRTRISSSAGCSLWASNTIDNDYYQTTGCAQKIKNGGSISVCQVDLLMQRAGADATVHVELWTAATGGSQIGADSEVLTINAAGFSTKAWGTFTFSTAPSPTTDFWIRLELDTGTIPRWQVDYEHATNDGTHYPFTDASDDAAYCAYAFSANRTKSDFTFKVYTQ